MKNNKKGFTLIELLAVIVVLAIIMVIATGQVTKTIDDARKNSFTTSYKMIIKEIKTRLTVSDLDSFNSDVTCGGTGEPVCLTEYGLSADDYTLAVTRESDQRVKVVLAGKGKFANVNYITTGTNADCPVTGACSAAAAGAKVNIITVYVDPTTGAVTYN